MKLSLTKKFMLLLLPLAVVGIKEISKAIRQTA